MTAIKNKPNFILLGLLLVVFASSMDQTIVATAMGTIVADIGGLDKFVWVTSAYLVAEMAVMPIFGKLSDMYGRKLFFIFGIFLFLIGSILSSTADNIVHLSIYRGIQGIGGGAMMPIAMSITLNVFPSEKHGKMIGMIGATFGISSIIGPLIGSFITDHLNWHWVFYINIPIGLIAIGLIAIFYKESKEWKKQKIDWWGAVTLVISVVSLMFALELGGQQYPWDSSIILGLFFAFVTFFILFIVAETRAEEPIISFQMFKKRGFLTGNILMVLYGAAFIVPIMFIPIFIQGVFGGTATNSGFLLLPMVIGVTISSIVGGLLVSKMSYRTVMIISGILLLLGMYLLGQVTTDTSRLVITLDMILTGIGVGFSFSVVYLAAIHKTNPKQHGSINSTLNFTRELGMVLGITVYGAIQSHLMSGKLSKIYASMGENFPKEFVNDPRQMLTPETRQHIPIAILQKLTDVLSTSIAYTFIWSLIPAGLAFITIFFMGKARLETSTPPPLQTEIPMDKQNI